MDICPICRMPLDRGICATCGYDHSRDYLRHPTFALLPENLPVLKPLPSDLHTCPNCGGLRFFRRDNENMICVDCRQEIPAPDHSLKLSGDLEQNIREFCFALIRDADVEQAPQLIRYFRSLDISSDSILEIFRELDNSLPYDLLFRHGEVLLSMGQWAQALNMVSRKVVLNMLLFTLREENASEEELLQFVTDLAKQRIRIDSVFFETQLLEQLAVLISDYESPRLTFMMLNLFDFSCPQEHQQYVHTYVSHSLKTLTGQPLLERILFLTDIAISPLSSFLTVKSDRHSLSQQYLENALKSLLPQHIGEKADRAIKSINRMSWYSSKIRSSAIQMLQPDPADSNSVL